jgi:hypothetical protein
MDEFNLADRFAEDDQRPNHFPVKRKKRRFVPGTGMQKPFDTEDETEHEIHHLGEEEDMEDMEEFGGPEEEEPEEDDAFRDLVGRLAGASASEGRAAKRRKMRAKPGNDSLRAEFADRK